MESFVYNTGNYDKYCSKNFLKRWMVTRLNSKILNLLTECINKITIEEKRTVKILDAGCGEGFISNLIFSNIPNVEIVGLEYTNEALKIARTLNKEITYIQGDIYQMPFQKKAFDIVLCTEVLEHLSKPEDALKELVRVTDSFLLLTVPNEPWFCLGNLLVLKNITRLGNPADHINHWTLKKFKSFTKKHLGYNIFYTSSFPWSVALFKSDTA